MKIAVFGLLTKTIKTPLMMAVAFVPTSCSSGLVPKSKLLHSPEVQYGFVPKLCHHGGKNTASLKNSCFNLNENENENWFPWIIWFQVPRFKIHVSSPAEIAEIAEITYKNQKNPHVSMCRTYSPYKM